MSKSNASGKIDFDEAMNQLSGMIVDPWDARDWLLESKAFEEARVIERKNHV